MTLGFPTGSNNNNNAGWNEQRETVRDFVARKLNNVTDETNNAWIELIEAIHFDDNEWDDPLLRDLGLYARSINNSISSDKADTDKIQTLVIEIFTHLACDVEREPKTNPFNRPEWEWVQGLVDTTPGVYVKLPPKKSKDDRQTLVDLLTKARSTHSIFVFVVIAGKTTQKISTRLLERLLNSDSDASRLVNLLYRPPVWNEMDDRLSRIMPSLDLVFASQTIQDSLDWDGAQGDTTQLFVGHNVPQRALEWLNKHAHDFEHAPIDQIDINLLRNLIESAQLLGIDRLHEMCLRRFMDVASPAQQKELSSLISQCIHALSSVKTLPESYEEMTDQVQKYREVIAEARGRGIPVTQSTSFSAIVEQIVEARIVETRKKEAPSLLLMFEKLIQQIPLEIRPKLSGDQTRDAETVRTWMTQRRDHLDQITRLDLSRIPMTVLPYEINLLVNLERLSLFNTQITALPTGFNPQNLRELYIHSSTITTLPVGFDPENLETLDLRNSTITTLPVGFKGQNLRELYIDNTRITALPDGFTGQNLRGLCISKTHITTLPVGFNGENLVSIYISNTKIIDWPVGFSPMNLNAIECDDLLFNKLDPVIKKQVRSRRI